MKRAFAIVTVNVLVFCVLAELASLAVFYLQHGWLFYRYPYREAHAPILETQAGRLTGDALHPYFGPTHRPGIPFDIPPELRVEPSIGLATNNFGFVSRHDYPRAKTTDRQFIVGLFGGSVGVWFCHVGAHRLVADLKSNAYFKDKELVPLCFSHEGYKQPQQLLVLAYFLSVGQPFDLVINIDGFNEVALSSINAQRGSDVSMPSAVHLDPLVNIVSQGTLTPAKLASLARISSYKQRLNEIGERLDRSRLASTNLAFEWYYGYVDWKYREELASFDRLPSNPSNDSIVQVTPPLDARQGSALFESIAREWATSSMLMHQLLTARAVPYFHFLQPNQYHTKRLFSSDEGRVALSDESPFKDSVRNGYPFLIAAVESVARGRVNVFDATGIFDRERAQVYIDNCCHYTLAGNQILADFIAKSVLNSSGPWQDSK